MTARVLSLRTAHSLRTMGRDPGEGGQGPLP